MREDKLLENIVSAIVSVSVKGVMPYWNDRS